MENKTNVTNASVPGSEDSHGVEGEKLKELENSIRNNLRAEYDRKSAELLEKFDAAQERIAELEEKDNLTRTELSELKRLQSQGGDIEEEIKILESNPKYRAYNEKIKRETERAMQTAVSESQHNMSIEYMYDFIDEKAAEVGMEPKELEKELQKICSDNRYRHLLPHRRCKLAFKDFKKERETQAEKLELKKLRDGNTFSEDANRERPKFNSLKEAKEKGSVIDQLKAVGQY